MRILIASGGSGGHIFPAVALARELERRKSDIIFVASGRRLDKKILQDTPYKKVFLSANPMPYKFGWSMLPFSVKLAVDSLKSAYILARYRPRVVVGFGGYTAGAILLLASLAKIKTIIHEQNVIPGRTNKFLEGFVSAVAVSFSETKKYFKNKNVVFTGNPLREESLEENRTSALNNFEFTNTKLTILVMGGSQGARSLNELVSGSIGLLPPGMKENIQLLHIAGAKEKDKVQKHYDDNGVCGKVYGFIPNINEAYSACDLAISRSGAAAIFELAAFKKPMILIPYPAEKNNQRFNAMFFADKKAALYMDEARLSREKLRDLVIELVNDPARRRVLAEAAGRLRITDGARRLKEVVLSV